MNLILVEFFLYMYFHDHTDLAIWKQQTTMFWNKALKYHIYEQISRNQASYCTVMYCAFRIMTKFNLSL